MSQTNKLVVNAPLGGISLCTLDELYSADRDIVAKLIGYLALSHAYNLVNDTLEMFAQVDDVEMIVTCRAAFECAYMDFAQKRAGSPIFEQLYALYHSARTSGLYASIPLMTEVYDTAIAIPGYTLADNQYALALGEMLAGLIPLCKALEAVP